MKQKKTKEPEVKQEKIPSNKSLAGKIVIQKSGEYFLKVNNGHIDVNLKQGQVIELWKK